MFWRIAFELHCEKLKGKYILVLFEKEELVAFNGQIRSKSQQKMKQLINSTIQDIRAILLIAFMLIILAGFFGAAREHTANQNSRETMDTIESNSVTSLEIILWAIGIGGTVGTFMIIISFLRQSSNGFL